jgi:hypothetical protein
VIRLKQRQDFHVALRAMRDEGDHYFSDHRALLLNAVVLCVRRYKIIGTLQVPGVVIRTAEARLQTRATMLAGIEKSVTMS